MIKFISQVIQEALEHAAKQRQGVIPLGQDFVFNRERHVLPAGDVGPGGPEEGEAAVAAGGGGGTNIKVPGAPASGGAAAGKGWLPLQVCEDMLEKFCLSSLAAQLEITPWRGDIEWKCFPSTCMFALRTKLVILL
jgi:hypothetical protein